MNKNIKVYLTAPFAAEYRGTLINAIKSSMPPHAQLLLPEEIAIGGTIADAIQAQIAASDVVIADITTSNPNVMYELGFANAMGKVILPITASPIHELPVSLRQYYVIQFDDSPDGLSRLKDKISTGLLSLDYSSVFSRWASRILDKREEKTEVLSAIDSAIQYVDILALPTAGLTNSFAHSITSAMERGVRLRFLLLDPESSYLVPTIQSHTVEQFRSDLRHDLLRLMSLGYDAPAKIRGLMQIRLIQSQPFCRFIRVDTAVYVTISPSLISRESMMLEFSAGDSRIDTSLLSYFEASWAESMDCATLSKDTELVSMHKAY